MCGIAGIFGTEAGPATFGKCAEMVAAMRHRGPDGHGVYGTGALTMGCARLAVSGSRWLAAPLTGDDAAMSYNGEMYQLQDIPARSDAERLFPMLVAGPGALDRLDGMYALAFGGPGPDRLLLARDQFGIKPLFVARTADAVVFASELPALAAATAPTLRLEPPAIGELLLLGSGMDEATLLSGIRELAPGTSETWRRDGWRITGSGARIAPGEPDDPAVPVPELLRAATLACARSNRRLGLFLSGGVDSLSLAFLLAGHGVTDVHTFSLLLDGDGVPDLAGLALPGQAWRSWRHHAWRPHERDVDQAYSAALATAATPCFPASAAYTLLLSQRADRAGVRVVLSGEGADELFAGYSSYPQVLHGSQTAPVDEFYLSRDIVDWVRRLLPDLGAGWLDGVRSRLHDELPDEAASVDRILTLERRYSLRPLLTRLDVTSMRHSIEVRVPFLHGGVPSAAAWMSAGRRGLGGRTKPWLRAQLTSLLGDRAYRQKRALRLPPGYWSTPARRGWLVREISDAADELPVDRAGLRALVQRTTAGATPAELAVSVRLHQLVSFCRRYRSVGS